MRQLTSSAAGLPAVALLATTLLAACDAGPAASADAGCGVVGEAEIEEALGFDVTLHDNSNGNCVIVAADGSPSAPALDFRIEQRTSPFDYFSAQPDATPIPDLGERAVWATANETTGSVVIVTGGRAIVVTITEADGAGPAARRQAEAVARLLLESDVRSQVSAVRQTRAASDI